MQQKCEPKNSSLAPKCNLEKGSRQRGNGPWVSLPCGALGGGELDVSVEVEEDREPHVAEALGGTAPRK